MTNQFTDLEMITDEELQAAAGGFWGLIRQGATSLAKSAATGAALGGGFEGGKELVTKFSGKDQA